MAQMTKRMEGQIEEIQRQMRTNAEMGNLKLARQDWAGAGRDFSMACAFAISLQCVYEGLGGKYAFGPEWQTAADAQGSYAHKASDASRASRSNAA